MNLDDRETLKPLETTRRVHSASDRLDSWKEIAAYLRRSTRCVQRWEIKFGLPIHRLRHAAGKTVYAYADELESWWRARELANVTEPA